jgi:hypothetical protein
MVRRSIAALVLCIGALFAVPGLAAADTGNIIEPQQTPGTPQSAGDGWQAGSCTVDAPKCSPVTPGQFFKTAGGHPPIGFTQYIIQHDPFTPLPAPFPAGSVTAPIKAPQDGSTIKTLRVELPPGLTVNPQATGEQCSVEDFLHEEEKDPVGKPGVETHVPLCKIATKVGREEVTLATNIPGFPLGGGLNAPEGFVIPPSGPLGTNVDVYNLVPAAGEPALFGFIAAGKEVVFLKTDVSWQSDFHENFTISLPPNSVPFSTLVSRLVNIGTSGDGTYITNPITCFNPAEPAFSHLYSTYFRAESYLEPDPAFPAGSTAVEAPLPPGVRQEGCQNVPFDPTLEIDSGTAAVDSPAPATVTTKLPVEKPAAGEHELAQSHLRKAEVKMPAGMGLNPAGSVGLVACSEADFAKGERVESTCPKKSIIGTAEIETPPLPAGSLKGNIYVGEQLSTDPASGEEFRTLVEAKSARFGIVVRLVGKIKADPKTGQLTAVFDEQETSPLFGNLPRGLPQVPFSSVKLKFDGSKAVLSTPPTCGNQTATSVMEPWSSAASTKTPSGKFTLSSVPGGGTCPTTLASRAFLPSYTAKTDSAQGGSFSPFRVHIGRPDGQQEVKGVDVTLPKGLTGNLAGIPYCSEAALTAAAANKGELEREDPSCGASSQIGVAVTEAGTGAAPLKMRGKAFLAGPYKGAPISMAIVTPAVSGPFDLGTVVVRVALNVNPLTAQIHAVSDVIPDVFGGVKLDLRSIDVNLDRSHFMLNPTNCAAQATTGAIKGGGADPTNPAAFSSYAVNVPFQASNCGSLGFKPKLKVQLFGPTTRAHFPRLRATLETREGDANISSTSLTLPHALFLEQNHIGTVCTNPKLASHTCPADSVYGQAEAFSPLLDQKLSGPVYLVPSGNKLPDLVADLQGQVEIQLHGVISSKHGGLRTVFNAVPDVPVTKFVLNMQGGKKSLLVNSTNTCKGKQRAALSMTGQNGKTLNNNKFGLDITSCAKKKKKHTKHHK